jgi:hypothetical protein
MFTITTGYMSSIPVTLKKAGATFDIPVASAVKAAIVSSDHTEVLIPAVDVVDSVTGADWPNSLIVVVFSEAETALLKTASNVFMEIQVDDNGKTPWFVSGEVVKGNIS